ncbi:hypothetical protein L6164_009464 [Bauhinia variegata]|uniref:Uncharacterized protein n=1 Tax=Bauhinia variegata TaxID=167791 RepID=A0ACB9PK22_BAUVA|nr:hypothetical protein L6164_009464 [Bauhinia variegata]
MDKIEHFSHRHPLVLQQSEQKTDDEKEQRLCSGCEEPISGACYCCLDCDDNFILHKSCVELPRQLKRPTHPRHPLILLSKPPYPCICSLCRRRIRKFVYHCSLCQYDLDIACASLCGLIEDGHKHSFISLKRPIEFPCYACGVTEADGFPFLCTVCQIWVHPTCAQLPQTIKIVSHNHNLNLNFSLHKVYGFKNMLCKVCNINMSSSCAGYFCSECTYPVHLKCAAQAEQEQSKGDSKSEMLEYIEHDETGNPYKVIKLGEDGRVEEIKHFSHHHALKLVEQQRHQDADKLCDGCIQPISPPFFACAQNCSFLLHKNCSELPRTIERPCHQHPLNLLFKAPHFEGIFRCDNCKLFCNGFVYRCEECQFDLDIRCGSLPETLVHENHEHPLLLNKTTSAKICKGCNRRSRHVFVCQVCDGFAIDYGCATLPSKTWHIYDKHPLNLTYGHALDLTYSLDADFIDDFSERNCEICKENMVPTQWSYDCEDCNFSAHPHCVVGKSNYVKFGSSFMYDAHSHPLTLVEKIRGSPACGVCGERCVGWGVECGQCSFYMHREGVCFWEQFKDSAGLLSRGKVRTRLAANVLAVTPNVTNK